jgi:hypothetical protein
MNTQSRVTPVSKTVVGNTVGFEGSACLLLEKSAGVCVNASSIAGHSPCISELKVRVCVCLDAWCGRKGQVFADFYKEWRHAFNFVGVYIAEAHAQDKWPISSARYNGTRGPVLIPEPTTDERRCQVWVVTICCCGGWDGQ